MFSTAIERALVVAVTAHDGQIRKGNLGSPYAVHPVHVALMLARLGSEETAIVAALLHDTVEDCEDWDIGRVRGEFGDRVASIVAEVSEDTRRPWRDRKEAGIEDVARMSADAATLKALDELHNFESLRAELGKAADPESVWSQFHGGRRGTLEIARRKVDALGRRVDPRLSRELHTVLTLLTDLARART